MRSIRLNQRELQILSQWQTCVVVNGAWKEPLWRMHNLFNEILVAYHESQRSYHDFAHIDYGLRVIEDIAHLLGQPQVVVVAYLYHDVIYHPGAKDNEERSVEFMERQLKSLGVSPAFIAQVGRYILCTKHTGEPIPERDAQYLVDVDLAQLGGSFKRFNRNTAKIAFEYAKIGITAENYATGRRKFFESLLARPHIYNTAYFRRNAEAEARSNLKRALAVHPS